MGILKVAEVATGENLSTLTPSSFKFDSLNETDESNMRVTETIASLSCLEPTSELEARARSEFTLLTLERGATFTPADGGCHAWTVCATTFLSYGLVDMSVNIFGLILASIKSMHSDDDVTFKLCENFPVTPVTFSINCGVRNPGLG